MSTLYLVPTPLGNLGDLTFRAVEVLQKTPVIAVESKARALKLISHLGLSQKKLISCREDNRKQAIAAILDNLNVGLEVAVISDAGTPGICDPGSWVVQSALEAGHNISPLPGPSALAAAVSAAGFVDGGFLFLGFLPAKQGACQRLLAESLATGWPLVFYEAPHRIKETIAILSNLVPARRIVWLRELSKLNEEILHTTVEALAQHLDHTIIKGEMTLVLAGAAPAVLSDQDTDALIKKALEQGLAPSAAARQVARQSRRSRDDVYQRLLVMRRDE